MQNSASQASRDLPALSDTYRRLNSRRLEIDQRIMALPPDDRASDVLWQELEATQELLRELVSKAAKAPARGALELRAKAMVVAMLLRSRDPHGTVAVADEECTALALSFADDIIQWLG